MNIEIIQQTLKEQTNFCFSERWYELTSIKIYEGLNSSFNNAGYVYFVRITGTDKVKIGSSKNIMNRILSFRTTIPNISLDGFVFCDDYKLLEKKIHEELKDVNHSQEWFNLSQNKCQKTIKDKKGVLVFCKITNNLFIEDGALLNSSENSLIVDDFEEINLIINQVIKDFFLKEEIDCFYATPTDIKNSLFFDNDEIKIISISKFLRNKNLPNKNKRYNHFKTGERLLGKAFLFKREVFE